MQEPTRVLQLITTLVSGGVQRVVISYSEVIHDYGIAFDYLVQGTGNAEIEEKVRENGSNIYELPPVDKHPLAFSKRLYRLLKRHPEYKAIHVHQNYLNGLPLFVARLAGVKVRISHSHGNRETHSIWIRIIRWFARKIIVRNATDLWACSNVAYHWLYGKSSKNPYILHNAVDSEKFKYNAEVRESIRAKLHLADKYVCVCVATLSRIKNQIFLLEVFKRIKSQDNYRLLLVGEGDMHEVLEQEIVQSGLSETVHILGDRSDVSDILQACDCFLLPSLTEGLPLSVVEAQMSGMPCIVSTGVPNEVKISTNIYFMDIMESDVETWASKIVSLHDLHIERRGISEQTVKGCGYSIAQEAEKLYQKYGELAAR